MDVLSLLIQVLPLEYATALTRAINFGVVFVGTLSVVLAAAKPLLAMLPPGARRWVDGASAVLDKIALNTTPLHERPLRPSTKESGK